MRAGIPVNEDYRAPRTLAHKVDPQPVHGNKLAEVRSRYLLIGFAIGVESFLNLASDVFLVHIHPLGSQWVAALRNAAGRLLFRFRGAAQSQIDRV